MRVPFSVSLFGHRPPAARIAFKSRYPVHTAGYSLVRHGPKVEQGGPNRTHNSKDWEEGDAYLRVKFVELVVAGEVVESE
jgi:hypothetical protein